MTTQQKECPQCDGNGSELFGPRMITCRRCGGIGSITKTSSEKTVQAQAPVPPKVALAEPAMSKTGAANDDEEENDRQSYGYYGSGIDETLLGVEEMSDLQVMDAIYDIVGMMDDDKVQEVFNIACEAAGTSSQAQISTVSGSDGEFSPDRAKPMIWNCLGRANSANLKQAFLKIRQI